MSLFKRCAHKDRARDNCGHPWWSAIVWRGDRVQESLEQYFAIVCRGPGSKTQAHEWERKLAERIRSGEYYARAVPAPAPPSDRLTFAQFVPLYVAGHCEVRGLRSYETNLRYRIDALVVRWGARPLRELRLPDVVAVLAELKRRGRSPATRRRYFALMRHLFNWAEANDYIERTPIRRGAVVLEAEDNERDRRLLPEEETAIRTHADPYLTDVLDVALDTGLRMGTIAALQFGHVRWSQGRYGVIDVPGRHLKGGHALMLPLTARVRGVFDRRRIGPDGERLGPEAFIFGNEVGEPFRTTKPIHERWTAAKAAARKATGLDFADLRFHDLRGEAASRLADMGVPVRRIQRFLGHSTLTMTERYLRSRVGDLDDAVEGLGRYVLAAEEHRESAVQPAQATGTDAVSTQSTTVVPLRPRRNG